MLLIVFLAFVIITIYFVKNHIVFRIDTFFRKGFQKHDDDYGIYTFCGKQGDGKTYSIFDTLNEILGDKTLILNVESVMFLKEKTGLFAGDCCRLSDFPVNEKKFDKIRKFKIVYENDFEEIYNFLKSLSPEQCSQFIVFYDELFSLIEKGRLSKEMLTFISQMRKRHLYLFTTVQEWLELNVTFRRYVRFMIDCKMRNPKILNFAISVNKVYDAYQMKWDNLQNEYVCPLLKTTIKKCSKAVADSYDTFEVIKTQGSLVKKRLFLILYFLFSNLYFLEKKRTDSGMNPD